MGIFGPLGSDRQGPMKIAHILLTPQLVHICSVDVPLKHLAGIAGCHSAKQRFVFNYITTLERKTSPKK